MTKKDLLENDVFKALPYDAEIVFATDADISRCVPLNALNLSVVRQNKTALVFDAIPYWFLIERYGITIKKEE